MTVLAVIENMSYFIAPDTGNCHEIFGRAGACAEYSLISAARNEAKNGDHF